MEDDGLVDTVQELRTHPQPQLIFAQVGGHDDDRVLEVDGAAFVVGKTAVVEHLQQDVEHVGMGLLDLVEQHDRVGFASYRFGQLTALVVSDVSRRRTDQTADRMGLLVLAHIDPGHHRLVVEQELRERLRQLRLTHSGSAEEEE